MRRIPVAISHEAVAAVGSSGADHAVNVGLRDRLENALGDGAQKIALVVLFCSSSVSRMVVLVIGGPCGQG
jgi:hypothetical protein